MEAERKNHEGQSRNVSRASSTQRDLQPAFRENVKNFKGNNPGIRSMDSVNLINPTEGQKNGNGEGDITNETSSCCSFILGNKAAKMLPTDLEEVEGRTRTPRLIKVWGINKIPDNYLAEDEATVDVTEGKSSPFLNNDPRVPLTFRDSDSDLEAERGDSDEACDDLISNKDIKKERESTDDEDITTPPFSPLSCSIIRQSDTKASSLYEEEDNFSNSDSTQQPKLHIQNEDDIDNECLSEYEDDSTREAFLHSNFSPDQVFLRCCFFTK
jgi:hypothetical protein